MMFSPAAAQVCCTAVRSGYLPGIPGIDTGKLNQLVDELEMEAAGRRLGQPRNWGEATVNGSVPVGLPWVVPSGFIRLMTHPRLLERPLSAPEATRRVRAWLEAPSVTVLQPGRRFAELFLGFLDTVGTAGNLTTETQLAALAVEQQAHQADPVGRLVPWQHVADATELRGMPFSISAGVGFIALCGIASCPARS